MTCDQVRELLPEHLLGALDETTDVRVRRHLRGCTECRGERMRLEDGIAALSHVTEQEPPDELRERTLHVLAEEGKDGEQSAPAGPTTSRPARRRWIAVAAAFVVLAGSFGFAAAQARRADRVAADASSYQRLLATLGGREFRLGTLQPMDATGMYGTVVLYDGKPGKDWNSWGIVMAQAPGFTGETHVTLVGANGISRALPPLHFTDGEASSWLVTHEDLTGYDEVVITAPDGTMLANARIVEA